MCKDDTFESERLFYRGIMEEDADYLVKWRSDPELIQHFGDPKPVTTENHLAWYRQTYLGDTRRYDFLILDKQTGIPVGTVGIKDLEPAHARCEISYMIAERSYQRKGLAKEAITAMMRRMQKEDIYNFIAVIHEDNLASIRTVQRLGYKLSAQEGCFAQYVWRS